MIPNSVLSLRGILKTKTSVGVSGSGELEFFSSSAEENSLEFSILFSFLSLLLIPTTIFIFLPVHSVSFSDVKHGLYDFAIEST